MDTETSKTTCMVSPAEMSQIGEDVGVYKASKRQILSFFSAIPAGAFIALAFVFLYHDTNGECRCFVGLNQAGRWDCVLVGCDYGCCLWF